MTAERRAGAVVGQASSPSHFIRLFTALLACLLACLLAACGGDSPGPADAAKQFFELCQQGKTAEAYERTTVGFKIERTEKYFDARVRDIGFAKTRGIQWQAPEIKGDIATIWGEFSLKNEGADDVKFTLSTQLHAVAGRWLIHQITTADSTVRRDIFAFVARSADTVETSKRAFVEPVGIEQPTDRLLEKMAQKSILEFNDAIAAKDFTAFFNSVSERWRYRGETSGQNFAKTDLLNDKQRLTIAALDRAFRPFMDAEADLSTVKNRSMKFVEPARITSDGVLVFIGEFPETTITVKGGAKLTQTLRTKLEYVFEGGRWKLFGISVDLLK